MTLYRAGVVAGQDMTTEAALTKLAYLLANPDTTPELVARYMSISLRGELTEHSHPVFRHPDGVLPERVKSLTAMGYAIAQGNLGKVKDIMKGEQDWILNDADYSGNTPLVRRTFFFQMCFFLVGGNSYNCYESGILTLIYSQHLAATSPNLTILRDFLLHGASVHLRNRAGHTPLFLAANAGLHEHVSLLRQSGAHLHTDENEAAELHARQRPGIWKLAGIEIKHDWQSLNED